jgi:hypothetical protein
LSSGDRVLDQQSSLERWAAAHLEFRRLRVTAAPSNPRPRPWSTVLRIETSGGVVWAKQGSAGARHEVALLEILAEACPDSVVLPIAADPTNGRLLLRDGGRILGEEIDAGCFDAVATWERVIRRYAALQRAVEPYVDRLLVCGVPDLRPDRIVDAVEAMLGRDDLLRLDQPDGLASRERSRLVELMPTLVDVARQADGAVASTVDHNDLHPFNVVTSGLRILDWGDAVIGHPFASLRQVGDLMTMRPGPPRQAARARFCRAYLEAWTPDVSPADLRAQVRVAPVLGAIAAASTWTRAPHAVVEQRPGAFAHKLRELLAHLQAHHRSQTTGTA